MKETGVRIAVVGAGAIGGITAAFLAREGWDVEVVCKHEETTRAAKWKGLHIFGVKGDFTVPVKAVTDIGDLSESKDIILLATKATECVDAARRAARFMREDSALVSLQNGICEPALAEVVGADRVVGCVTAWGATMHGPAELEMTSGGEFVLGNIENRDRVRLEFLKDMLGVIVPTRVTDNIIGELYSKLIVNSCITSLGAVTGLELGRMLAVAQVRRIFLALMREMMETAAALNITVEPGGGGKLDYYRFLEKRGPLAELKRHLTVRIIGFKYRRLRSSSLQSLERGRKTEIDFLNGYVVEKARQLDVPVPLNEAVVRMIKEIEAGKRKIAPANLEEAPFSDI